MTLKTLAAAACISMAMATSTFAAPITLDFEFAGFTGTFYGLDDVDGTGSATSFDLNFEGSSWTNVSSAGANSNSFGFSSGNLIFVDYFHTPNITNDAGEDLELFSSNINSADTLGYFYSLSGTALGGDVTFAINPVASVPLPAGGLLLLSGLGGGAAFKRRKKRAASLYTA